MIYDLGIIIPVYRGGESVRLLTARIRELFTNTYKGTVKIRICLVDDSGRRESAVFLQKSCRFPETSILVLDRNYGQQAATLCGLEHLDACRYYATIDEDLEQPPEMLLRLYETIQNGWDIVYGVPDRKKVPKVSPAENRTGAAFYRLCREAGSRMRDGLFSHLIGVPENVRVSSLRIMTAKTAADACRLKPHGFFYLSASVFKTGGKHLRACSVFYTPAAGKEKGGYSFSSLAALYAKLFWYYGVRPCKCLTVRPEEQTERLHGADSKPLYHISRRIRAPRLLILGGSNCQTHAFSRAEKRMIDTVLADYTRNPPAARLSGLHEPVSTFDMDGCIKAAGKHHIDGIMTMGTDQPVYTAAMVSKSLGLPTLLTIENARNVTNKRYMKERLLHAGIPTARFVLIRAGMRKGSLSGFQFPVVLKPLDSQGQRGVFRLNTEKEVFSHLEETLSFSREEEALVEEYYESSEITVSGWIQEGTLTILTVTDRLLFPDSVHIGVCTGHRFPSVHMDRYEEIEDISLRTVKAFELKNGPFYLQLLCGRDGILVNELACRIGGAFEDITIPFLTGFHILDAVIDSALGRPVLPPSRNCLDAAYGGGNADTDDQDGVIAPGRGSIVPGCPNPVSSGVLRTAVQLLFVRPGVIAAATPLEVLKALPFVLDAGYNYHKGQEVPVMKNATARFGHAVICGTKETIRLNIDEFYEHLSVRSVTGEEMILRLYPEE